jgi:hypothetical protein
MPPYFGNASGARFAKQKKGSIRRADTSLQRHGFDPNCQRAALFVASTKH